MPPPDTDLGEPGAPLSRSAPFTRGFLLTLGGLTALLLGFAVEEAADELVLILVAAFLAVGLNPVVEFVQRRGVARRWGVVIVAVVAFLVIVVVIFVLGLEIRAQIDNFVNQAPHLLHDLRRNRTVAALDRKYHVLSKLEAKLHDKALADNITSGVISTGITVVNALIDTVVVFVLTLYFLSGLPTITRSLYKLAPASRRDRVGKLGDEILRRVGGYVIGAVLVALLAGTVTALLLTAVGLGQYALVLGLAMAMLDLLPLVGAVLGAAIVCLVGLATSPTVGIICIVFYVIYELLEGYVIYPRVMRRTVDVPEYLTVVAVILGGAVGGIVGALLALPVAASLHLLVREVWVRRQDAA